MDSLPDECVYSACICCYTCARAPHSPAPLRGLSSPAYSPAPHHTHRDNYSVLWLCTHAEAADRGAPRPHAPRLSQPAHIPRCPTQPTPAKPSLAQPGPQPVQSNPQPTQLPPQTNSPNHKPQDYHSQPITYRHPSRVPCAACVKVPLIGCKGKEECLCCSERWRVAQVPRALPAKAGGAAA